MTYYDLLEINENASLDVIKAAYKTLAKKYHPDNLEKTDDMNHKLMEEINVAYDVLSDPQKRRQYDESIKNENFTKDENISKQDHIQPPFFTFIKDIGKGMVDSIQKNIAEQENAYLEGLNMPDAVLVNRFKFSRGNERIGYARALEKRRLIYRDSAGAYKTSDIFKHLF